MFGAGFQQPFNRYPYTARYPGQHQHQNSGSFSRHVPVSGGDRQQQLPFNDGTGSNSSAPASVHSSLNSSRPVNLGSAASSGPSTIEELLGDNNNNRQQISNNDCGQSASANPVFNESLQARGNFKARDASEGDQFCEMPYAAASDCNSSTRGRTTTNTTNTTTNSDCVVALSEGKGICRGELGLAALELIGCEIHLYHITDNISYDKSLALIEALQPGIVLLSDGVTGNSSSSYLSAGALNVVIPGQQQQQQQQQQNGISDNESQLAATIRDVFQAGGVVVRSVRRRFFNAAEGLKTLRRCAVPSLLSALEVQLKSKNYCFAALAALVHYVEEQQRMMLAAGSIMFRFKAVEDATVIDVISARNLELLASARPEDARTSSTFSSASNFQRPEQRQQCCHSLYAALNCTQTRVGARLLRANIMQPPTNLELIRTRLKSVKELMQNEQLLGQLRSVLSKMVDVDRLINFLICTPHRETERHAEFRIGCFISLKHVLMLVEPLRNALSQASSPLMQGYYLALRNECFDSMIADVEKVINYETLLVRGVLRMKMQKMFAVKPGLSGMLDICRRAFTECMGDMNKIAEQLARQYDLPPLKLDYDEVRGFHLEMNASKSVSGRRGGGARNNRTRVFAREFRHEDLPPEFVKVSRNRNTYRFTTLQLMRCNGCARDTIIEAFRASSQILLPLMNTLRSNMACLYSLSEAVAQLDMISGLVVSCTSRYAKGVCVLPKFSETCLAFLNSRHPLLPPGSVIPNDVFSSLGENTAIITGPNMSGKSTFLRQIALLQIMAQIGAPLPCDLSVVRVCDQIFTRFGSDDDIETNASSFAVEMREVDFILRNATERSLVIIDELGRGTRADEAVGICFAVVEQLAAKRAFVWFATHYGELSALATMYTNIRNYHFQCSYTIVMPNGGEVSEETTTDDERFNLLHAEYSKNAPINEDAATNSADSSVPSARLSTNHRLADGACTTHHYGIQMAAAMGFPRSVVAEARQLVRDVDRRFVVDNMLELELQNLQVRHGGRLANFVQGRLDEMAELETSLAKKPNVSTETKDEQKRRLKRKHNDRLFELMLTVKREFGEDVRKLQQEDDLRMQQQVQKEAQTENANFVDTDAVPRAERNSETTVDKQLSQLSIHVVENQQQQRPTSSSPTRPSYISKPPILFSTQRINEMYADADSPMSSGEEQPTELFGAENEARANNEADIASKAEQKQAVLLKATIPDSNTKNKDEAPGAADDYFFRYAPVVYDETDANNSNDGSGDANEPFIVPSYASFSNLLNNVPAAEVDGDAGTNNTSTFAAREESPVIETVATRPVVGRATRTTTSVAAFAQMPPPNIPTASVSRAMSALPPSFTPLCERSSSLPLMPSTTTTVGSDTGISVTARGIFYSTLMAQNNNSSCTTLKQQQKPNGSSRKQRQFKERQNFMPVAHAYRNSDVKTIEDRSSSAAVLGVVKCEQQQNVHIQHVQHQRRLSTASTANGVNSVSPMDGVAWSRHSSSLAVVAEEEHEHVEQIEITTTTVEKRVVVTRGSSVSSCKRLLNGEFKPK